MILILHNIPKHPPNAQIAVKSQARVKQIQIAILLQEMVITELQAESTYSVAMAAYTTKGDGARSKPKLITTTGAGKGPVTAVNVPCDHQKMHLSCRKLWNCTQWKEAQKNDAKQTFSAHGY